MSEWISVEDRLPKEKLRVLVAPRVEIARFLNDQPIEHHGYYPWETDRDSPLGLESSDVTHWMPLPEPPTND